MGLVRKAVLYTLLLHVAVLGALVALPVSEVVPPSEQFTEVTMLDAEDLVTEAPQSFEDQLRAQMAEKVANLRANAESAASSEARSSSDDGPSEAELAAQVEAELRAMEAAEFERLGAEEKEFETAGEADVTRQEVGADLREVGRAIRRARHGSLQPSWTFRPRPRRAWLHVRGWRPSRSRHRSRC